MWANEHGHQVDRNDWSLGNIPVYVAETNEQAFEDISAGAMHEITSYPFKGGGKSTYEAYPGQPEEEITFEQIVNQRRWIVGDPDHCIAQIRAMQEDSGGFGALLMLTLEWTSTERWYKSLEAVCAVRDAAVQGQPQGLNQLVRAHGGRREAWKVAQLAVGARLAADRPGAGPVARRAAQEADDGRAGRQGGDSDRRGEAARHRAGGCGGLRQGWAQTSC